MSKTLWFTGLSGAGKTTLAEELKNYFQINNMKVFIVDGDQMRNGVNKDLGFDENARSENIRRSAEFCKLLNQQNIFVIACLTSPLNEQRELAKNIIGKENFLPFYIQASVDTCKSRDVKGLYDKYDKGEIKHMIGIDLPFEEPSEEYFKINTNLGESLIYNQVVDIWNEFVKFLLLHSKKKIQQVVKLRFNHNAQDLSERWRLYFPSEDKYINASEVYFDCITATTEDVLNDSEGHEVTKWHISAMYTDMKTSFDKYNKLKKYIFTNAL